MNAKILDWLLKGDPAVIWQVQRDLLDEPVDIFEATRQRLSTEGWVAQFLSYQDPEGTWGGGLYGPKWLSTTYTLLTLRRLGLPPNHPQAQKGCQLLLDGGYMPDEGINYIRNPKIHHSETCITGMVLSLLAYFRYADERLPNIAAHLLRQQMPDGGWNCRSYEGDTHSSFHTTLSTMEGLWEYEKTFGLQSEIGAARARAHEFLWRHRIYRSHRTGEIFDCKMTGLSFPPRWRYDLLRVLDYFWDCNAPRDPRTTEGVELLRSKQRKDGTWPLNSGMSGRFYFHMEKIGQPSRMNTLRALRVLKWWQP
ncbi:MAG TPA: hypothetical protein DEH22_17880 [Chloroflexi bacterium]|nr:hypothetical protein [Chloroflexota bacterium]